MKQEQINSKMTVVVLLYYENLIATLKNEGEKSFQMIDPFIFEKISPRSPLK